MAAPVKMWLVLLIIHCVHLANGVKQKHVSVTLDAKWKSTPILLEASEFIAKESEEKFWSFVDDFSQLAENEIDSFTDQAFYETVKKFSVRQLSQMQMELLKFALALRAMSPKVAMFNQMARDYGEQFGFCEAFVNVHGQMTCDLQVMKQLIKSASERPAPPTFKFDHTYPGSSQASVTVLLYAELGRKTFTDFHSLLKNLANDGQIRYILRHYVKTPVDDKVRLSGYGVELAIKSTEYKAKDDTKVEDGGKTEDAEDSDQDEDVQGFVFSTLRKLHPDSVDDLAKFKAHLVESSTELASLKVWQLQDLSYQAAQRVLLSPHEDVLKVLTDLSQNFPSRTRSLVNVQVNSKVKQEIQQNQKFLQNNLEIGIGESALFVNGLQIDLEVMDMFLLLDLMRSEAKLLDGLHATGIQGEALTKLLSLNLQDTKEYALDFRHDSVVWVNDLENDAKYRRWPNNVEHMLQPTWPGMLRHVAKNFFHLVLYVDPADKQSIPLVKMAESFYVHSAPIRIGLVLVCSAGEDVDYTQDACVALYRAFQYVEDSYDEAKALSFLTDVYEKSDDVTPEHVVFVFKNTITSRNIDGILGSGSQYDESRLETRDYFEGTGLGDLPQALLNGVPLKKSVLNMNDFEESVVSTVMQATSSVQRDVYQGRIHNSMNILDHLMDKDHVLSRLNSRVLSNTNATYLSFSETTNESLETPPDADMAYDKLTAAISTNMKYLTKHEDDSVHSLTTWVVTDLGTEDGRLLLYSAIKSLKSTSDMRLGVVHNPKAIHDDNDSAHLISRAVQAALNSQQMKHAKLFVTKLLKEENVVALTEKQKSLADLEVNGMKMNRFNSAMDNLKSTSFLKWGQMFAQRTLRFRPGNRGIVANGKILGPLRSDEAFVMEDFVLLDQFTVKKSASKVRDAIHPLNLRPALASELIMKACALLESQTGSESARRSVEVSAEKHSVISLPAKPDSPAHDVVAILDPLSREAQKLSPLLIVLKEVTNVKMKLIFNCKDKLSEMPLKSYYRFVLEPELQFRPDGSMSSGPSARFTNLPLKPILTLNMNPPESWLVETVRAAYDLDNIVMEEVENNVNAELELEYLLLEGHCFDSSSGQPPRGLQFTLGTSKQPDMVDTIVMANLGYFQLKANPGSWLLDLRAGRSAELYDIASHEYTDSLDNERPLTVVIDSFRGNTVKIHVKKKPDKLDEDLLSEGDDSKSMWDSLSSTFTGGDSRSEDKDETLNIFSLASGHLYERFLRLMMLSVIKNTQSKVKFWFLKNYLSPTFKDFIPYYAEKYGFEYELVQYKWPRWLHQQTEKQRIIWGYKILFLDVLFPLHVKKIIFVDADQTVRADLQELYDLDLGGAPYGYTPFCDSREDMDGFRFWKQGYWMNHLAGRKYHISALYVVDLKRFRRIAAGDRLRGQYQGLSQDPNSLSNLDQDLPNNMIHQVSIKSLPQEWLWCETWCDDESKKKAKTIDLCNNPKTKEPKLKAAERIVAEWKDYDNEIKQLWDEFLNKSTTSKSRQSTETSTEKNIKQAHGHKKEEL